MAAPSSSMRGRTIAKLAFLVVLLTPLPKRLGIYEAIFSLHPAFVGLYPSSVSSEARWGYTFDELYASDGAGGPSRLSRQTAIVTGANSGIGYEISLALARLGASVTMACRDPTKCERAAASIRADPALRATPEARRGTVATMTVDVSSLSSVKQFCRDYLEKLKGVPLDMLFLNAAIKYADVHADGVSLHLTEDGIESTFATNVVGHHLMYKLLEPALGQNKQRTTPARVVLTSSAVSYLVEASHKVPTDLETLNAMEARDPDLYHQSKLAQVLWTKELTARLDASKDRNSGNDPNTVVYANAANPGAVATKIWRDGTWNNAGAGISGMFWNAFTSLHQSWFMWTPEEGSLTPLYLGTAVEELREKDIRGQYFHPQSRRMEDHVLFPEDNAGRTKELQQNLWIFLDKLVADFA